MITKKNELNFIQKTIAKIGKTIEKLKGKEQRAVNKWKKLFQEHKKASKFLGELELSKFLTKKAERARKIVIEWISKTEELTAERDKTREEIKQKEEEMKRLEIEAAELIAKIEAEEKETDEIIKQVFVLTRKVKQALIARNDYLNAHLYNRMIDKNGNLRSQLTLTSSDELERVVVLTNYITRILPELAEEARGLIDDFFARFQQEVEMEEKTKALYQLTSNLLVEKKTFKVGPSLYQFLGIKIDSEVFPELRQAQLLLGKSLRSEKTDTYIRIYVRERRTDKWIQEKLT